MGWSGQHRRLPSCPPSFWSCPCPAWHRCLTRSISCSPPAHTRLPSPSASPQTSCSPPPCCLRNDAGCALTQDNGLCCHQELRGAQFSVLFDRASLRHPFPLILSHLESLWSGWSGCESIWWRPCGMAALHGTSGGSLLGAAGGRHHGQQRHSLHSHPQPPSTTGRPQTQLQAGKPEAGARSYEPLDKAVLIQHLASGCRPRDKWR